MGETIVQVLGLALAVAIVPIPMIAVILMLLSTSAKRNSVSFLTGWLLGLSGLGIFLLVIGAPAAGSGGSELGGYIRLAIGAVLLFFGWRKWRSRPKDGEEAPMPRWMSAIEGFSAAKSFGIGITLAAANPKNIGLTFAAAATIATADLTSGQEIVTLLVFVVVSSLSVAVPVIAYLLAGSRATPTLDRMREWLVTNATTLIAVLFAVLGLILFADGITTVS